MSELQQRIKIKNECNQRETMNDEPPNLGDFRDLLHVMRYLEENIVVSNNKNINLRENNVNNVNDNKNNQMN